MTHPDHIAEDLRASEALFDGTAGRADLKALLQRSVLIAALENVAKFETEPSLKAAARARFLDLTDGRRPT
jgi:hypothetical protein